MSTSWKWKIVDKGGNAWLFGVYPSCGNCPAPAGVDVMKIAPKDFAEYRRQGVIDIDNLPQIPTHACGVGGIAVLDIEVMRAHVKASLLGTRITETDGVIDEAWADTLAEEAVPDLCDAVWKSQELFSRRESATSGEVES